jgi:hypothetical protein
MVLLQVLLQGLVGEYLFVMIVRDRGEEMKSAGYLRHHVVVRDEGYKGEAYETLMGDM